MDINTIKSYLVELGFEVDHPEMRKFEDAVRSAGAAVERMTKGMVQGAVVAGTEVIAGLTAIAGAAVGLMTSVADADLSFKMFARRMFLSEDAARHMKVALDALGVSAEDVIWGPPELAQRYRELENLQKRIESGFGGTGEIEKRLKQFRDIEFEFTKLKVTLGQLARGGVATLVDRLFGDGKAQAKLEEWLGWLIDNTPRLATELADSLAPTLKNVYKIWEDLVVIGERVSSWILSFIGILAGDPELAKGEVNIKSIGLAFEHISNAIEKVTGKLRAFIELVNSFQPPAWLQWFLPKPDPTAGLFGAPKLSGGGLIGGVNWLGKKSEEAFTPSAIPGRSIQQKIVDMALSMGIDPYLALAQAKIESSFNPNALGKPTRYGRAMGLFQLLPGTAHDLGVTNPYDPDQNIRGGLTYLKRQFDHFGNATQGLEAYNTGPGNVMKGTLYGSDAYAASILAQREKYASQGSTVNVGGVVVNLNGTNLTQDQAKNAVIDAMNSKNNRMLQRNLAVVGGVF